MDRMLRRDPGSSTGRRVGMFLANARNRRESRKIRACEEDPPAARRAARGDRADAIGPVDGRADPLEATEGVRMGMPVEVSRAGGHDHDLWPNPREKRGRARVPAPVVARMEETRAQGVAERVHERGLRGAPRSPVSSSRQGPWLMSIAAEPSLEGMREA